MNMKGEANKYGITSERSQPIPGTSLVVQWLGLHTPNAGGLGLIPWQIPPATTKTQHNQVNN